MGEANEDEEGRGGEGETRGEERKIDTQPQHLLGLSLSCV